MLYHEALSKALTTWPQCLHPALGKGWSPPSGSGPPRLLPFPGTPLSANGTGGSLCGPFWGPGTKLPPTAQRPGNSLPGPRLSRPLSFSDHQPPPAAALPTRQAGVPPAALTALYSTQQLYQPRRELRGPRAAGDPDTLSHRPAMLEADTARQQGPPAVGRKRGKGWVGGTDSPLHSGCLQTDPPATSDLPEPLTCVSE